VVGAVINGFTVSGRAFSGGMFDWLTPFSLFCGLGLCARPLTVKPLITAPTTTPWLKVASREPPKKARSQNGLFCGLGLCVAYALLGATWLVMKSEGALQQRMRSTHSPSPQNRLNGVSQSNMPPLKARPLTVKPLITFSGGMFDWLTPFSLFCGLGLCVAYALLGATWLVMKTTPWLKVASREPPKKARSQNGRCDGVAWKRNSKATPRGEQRRPGMGWQ
jgi:cytochrome bd-type quinol oxidase subunit 2